MDLCEFVLTHRGDGDEPLISIAEYYERYVKPLSPAFSKSSFYSARTVVCCFHEDINPSLGTIKHKSLHGVRLYHCFGCGAVGDVISMHQRIQREYHHRTITRNEAALELCKLFELDASVYETLDKTEEAKSAYVSKLQRIYSQMDSYTINEFKDDIMKVRANPNASDLGIQAINTACIKLIATKKKLID